MKLILGCVSDNSAIDKVSVFPPCHGYYTDFFWQVWYSNRIGPVFIGFGDLDLTNDVMPESSELEAVYGRGNAEIFFTEGGDAQPSAPNDAIWVKSSKAKVHARTGKPLTFGIQNNNNGALVKAILTAQFVPKNGATMPIRRKDATYLLDAALGSFFMRIPHDGYLKEFSVNYGIDGHDTAPFNGIARWALIRNITELNDETLVVSGDVYHGSTNTQDDTIGQQLGHEILSTPLHVRAAGEFMAIDDEKKNMRIKVHQGDLLVLKTENYRGTKPDNVSIDATAYITVRNAKRKKRNVYVDGTHVIQYVPVAGNIQGAARL